MDEIFDGIIFDFYVGLLHIMQEKMNVCNQLQFRTMYS